MSSTAGEPLRILRFWRDLEIFNIPTAPSARDSNDQTKITTLRRGNVLPWCRTRFKPTDKYGYVHVVYLGVADTEDLSRLLLKGLFPERDLSEGERQRLTGNGWLAAFVVNEQGLTKFDSYLPASFAHGVAALRETNSLENINARLERAKEEFAQRHQGLKVSPEDNNTPPLNMGGVALNWTDLDEELRILCHLLGVKNDPSLDWRMVVRTSRVKRRFLNDSLQAATDFLNSFYLDDLDRLIALVERNHPFGKALNSYLGPALDEQKRIDILTEHTTMAHLVSAKQLPSARWPAPSKYPLVLAQQAAVAQVIDSLSNAEGLIGVNGPPGTGKTTLLCDVIAEVVTERARRIAALDRPAALFEDRMTVAGKGFFPLKADVIVGTSIVVTSTNNNAVKNITQELPARKKIGEEFGSVDYFADVMREVFRVQKVLDEDDQPLNTWGTIAAALGNAGNRRSFAQGFFRDEYMPSSQAQSDKQDADTDSLEDETDTLPQRDSRPPSMKQILEEASNQYQQNMENWRRAKQSFLELQAEFDSYRKILELAEKAAQSIDAEQSLLDGIAAEAQVLDQDIQTRENTLSQLHEAQTNQRAIVEGKRAVLAQLRANTPRNLWDRLMGLFGHETKRMKALRQSLDAPTHALAEASTTLAEMSKRVAEVVAELKRLRDRLKVVSSERAVLERKLETHRRALQAGYATGAKYFPDAQFWCLSAETRHRASVAVSPRFDELRSKLFLQAVELHRLTVLANAGKFIANLRAVNGMLTGSSRDKLSLEHRPLVWDALFFVVPVVSTTLASFDRLFIGMGQSSLGWLLVDEAGQATPQSAAGAIWRSRRAVIVGDPLQIEPVFTVPRSLAEELRLRHEVASHWSPIDESVQTLADRITSFGSWVETTGGSASTDIPERLWTGMPLRTHRRCDDPMFSVSNRIAYADQMVQGRVNETGQPTPWEFTCCLGESAWFDVRSSRVNHPVSEDEIACLICSLEQLQSDQNGASKVYVISPFRKVAQACRQSIRQAGFGGIECGTVHTFQGKEANVVFLVLGTAPGQAGSGARGWAASKPNLLNVAVTRAQCRLYVIGDSSQWGGMDHFSELYRVLPTRSTNTEQRKPTLAMTSEVTSVGRVLGA
ncbi:AAA domain-containing protein [Providencia stuartii]|uniref:AAA domain-containing protein n=1 Tax=Shewanella algae TaxID=38313 RepID=UPI001288788F|nr:DNA helicase [Salmonella enterica]ECH1468070.1 DNA helicase [Salmonella enterica subsp. enterica serovar Infantis]EIP3767963.1 ATP-binding domain-containing protein [Salmonella enterica subsp. enterica serovar Montevideo]EBL7128797.1 DNA helicase [Salmonella enterica]ECM5886205.1 DNA helicase [Salmonella enterica subsp. enterica serovar Infantis]